MRLWRSGGVGCSEYGDAGTPGRGHLSAPGAPGAAARRRACSPNFVAIVHHGAESGASCSILKCRRRLREVWGLGPSFEDAHLEQETLQTLRRPLAQKTLHSPVFCHPLHSLCAAMGCAALPT